MPGPRGLVTCQCRDRAETAFGRAPGRATWQSCGRSGADGERPSGSRRKGRESPSLCRLGAVLWPWVGATGHPFRRGWKKPSEETLLGALLSTVFQNFHRNTDFLNYVWVTLTSSETKYDQTLMGSQKLQNWGCSPMLSPSRNTCDHTLPFSALGWKGPLSRLLGCRGINSSTWESHLSRAWDLFTVTPREPE